MEKTMKKFIATVFMNNKENLYFIMSLLAAAIFSNAAHQVEYYFYSPGTPKFETKQT